METSVPQHIAQALSEKGHQIEWALDSGSPSAMKTAFWRANRNENRLEHCLLVELLNIRSGSYFLSRFSDGDTGKSSSDASC
nr:hypothetical protein [Bacillus glycinifermentans]